jgi:hypothetical protein
MPILLYMYYLAYDLLINYFLAVLGVELRALAC